MGYTFIDEMTKAKQHGSWKDLQKRMAKFLLKKPTISQMIGFNVDELDSVLGVCPCGQGIIVAYTQKPKYFYESFRYYPEIICSNCASCFDIAVRILDPILAIDSGVGVEVNDHRGVDVILPLYSRMALKMLSW